MANPRVVGEAHHLLDQLLSTRVGRARLAGDDRTGSRNRRSIMAVQLRVILNFALKYAFVASAASRLEWRSYLTTLARTSSCAVLR